MTQGYTVKEISKRQQIEPQKVNQMRDKIKKVLDQRLRNN